MSASYWKQVLSRGLAVPSDRPLAELTGELTTMLGSPDPAERDGTAYPTLSTWLERGVYDDLLEGLGDGMAAGLAVGVGERESDTVFRRSYSVLVLADCIERDTSLALVPGGKVLEWGDRIATWFLRERDTRGFVPGHGWARALAHGADALGSLAASPHLGVPELTVILDVLADRAVQPTPSLLMAGEPDRMARATLRLLRRDVVPLRILEPWVARIAATATNPAYDERDPFLSTGNAEAFLRALHLQLALAPRPPAVRSDLLLVLVDALRISNAHHLEVPRARFS